MNRNTNFPWRKGFPAGIAAFLTGLLVTLSMLEVDPNFSDPRSELHLYLPEASSLYFSLHTHLPFQYREVGWWFGMYATVALALVVAGYLTATRASKDSKKSLIKLGSSIATGYFVMCFAPVLLAVPDILAPTPGSSVPPLPSPHGTASFLTMSVVYPAFFGGIGGWMGYGFREGADTEEGVAMRERKLGDAGRFFVIAALILCLVLYAGFLNSQVSHLSGELSEAEERELELSGCIAEYSSPTGVAQARSVPTQNVMMPISVEVDESDGTVTIVVVDKGNGDFAYVEGDHLYENNPVLCEEGDQLMLTEEKLKDEGQLRLVGVRGVVKVTEKNGVAVASEMGVERENVLTVERFDFSGEDGAG